MTTVLDDPPLPEWDNNGESALVADSPQHRLVVGLAKIGLAARHQAWRGAHDQNLTPTQGQILALLRAQPDAGLRLSAVASQLAVSAATVSDSVRVLSEKGLVRKDRARDDGRAVALYLTELGEAAAAQAAGWSDYLLSALDALTPNEQEAFLRGIVKVIRTLQVRGEIPLSGMCLTCTFFRPNVHPGATFPHHCAFVDAPLRDRLLRLDCADHEAAPAPLAALNWRRFNASGDEAQEIHKIST